MPTSPTSTPPPATTARRAPARSARAAARAAQGELALGATPPALAPTAPPPPPPRDDPDAGQPVAATRPTGPRGPAPEAVHPALWRAHQLGRGGERVEPTGHAALDAELPGGGWPHRALTELLVAGPGLGEIRLLASVLARLTAAGRGVLLVAPPADPCAAAWEQLGIDLAHCVLVRPGVPSIAAPPAARRRTGPAAPDIAGADLLWSVEQALRSGHVGAVLAWTDTTLKADALRRLQLAAQSHEGPAFLFRPPIVAAQPSPAPLRLALGVAGPDALSVQVLKRRGPAREQALALDLAPVLAPGARERARRVPVARPARVPVAGRVGA